MRPFGQIAAVTEPGRTSLETDVSPLLTSGKASTRNLAESWLNHASTFGFKDYKRAIRLFCLNIHSYSAACEAGTANRNPAATASSRNDFTAASESSAAVIVASAGSFLSTSAGAVMIWLHVIRLHHVENFTRDAQMISTCGFFGARDGVLHNRPVVNAEIREAASKHRHAGGRATVESLDGPCDLLTGKDGRHIDFDTSRESVRTASKSGSPRVFVTGNFT